MERPDPTELRKLYIDDRMTTRQLGEHYGVSHMSIKRWLREFGIPRRSADRGLRNRGIEAPTAAELNDLVHVQHLSYADIGERYGVDQSAVPHWLKRHGIPRPTVWQTRRRGATATKPTAAEIRERYGCGESLSYIGADHGISARTVRDLCREYGIEVRPDGWQGGRRIQCLDGHQVRSTYEQRVDDWLTGNGIVHELEPRLPFDRRYMADFRVGEIYIEIWGVVGSNSYDERKRRKIDLYREHGLELVELHPWSFSSRGGWLRRLHSLADRVTDPL